MYFLLFQIKLEFGVFILQGRLTSVLLSIPLCPISLKKNAVDPFDFTR